MKFNCGYKICGIKSVISVTSCDGKFTSSKEFDGHLSRDEIAAESNSLIEEMERIINVIVK